MKGQTTMFLPNDYLVYEYGKELQREADNAALVRLAREDAPAPYTHWFSQLFAMIRRPHMARSSQQQRPETPRRQKSALRRV